MKGLSHGRLLALLQSCHEDVPPRPLIENGCGVLEESKFDGRVCSAFYVPLNSTRKVGRKGFQETCTDPPCVGVIGLGQEEVEGVGRLRTYLGDLLIADCLTLRFSGQDVRQVTPNIVFSKGLELRPLEFGRDFRAEQILLVRPLGRGDFPRPTRRARRRREALSQGGQEFPGLLKEGNKAFDLFRVDGLFPCGILNGEDL